MKSGIRIVALLNLLLFLAFTSCKKNMDESMDYSSSALADPNSSFLSDESLSPQPGLITAGEWCDLNNWLFWMELIQGTYVDKTDYWQMYPSQRYNVMVTTEEGVPVTDCTLKLLSDAGDVLWISKSDCRGKSELWENPYGENYIANSIEVTHNGYTQTLDAPTEYQNGNNLIKLPVVNQINPTVEVVFVVDATGSMGDEIEYLKSELGDVIVRSSMNNSMSIRLGAVFYRDSGDDYITKVTPLSSNINSTLSFINQQEADGGGDYPESVEKGLQTAINMSWSEHAVSRILFLLLDAPPHHNSQVLSELHSIVRVASQKGIKIIPITASGSDKETEFLCRFMAALTNGTYVFITDHSGIGEDHIEATVGQFEVEYLNDLLVRLITKYSDYQED